MSENHSYGIWAAASWGHEVASSSSPGYVAPTARPTVQAGTRTLVGPADRLRTGFVLSPGGWTPPPGVLPAWNWLPSEGAAPRLDLAPWWARAWYHLPFIDRYAHAWMWRHGACEVRPPDTELGHIGGTD
jgi:hypothetical protein